MNELVPYNDLERMGTMIAKSKLFGMKTPEEAIALCLIAQAEGKHPASAAQEYNIIQGKPALKADAMMARFQAAGGKVNWLAYSDKEVTGEFSHAQGGSVKITWNMEMATKLNYHTKDNWKKFPRAMMRARCISEGIRTVYPGISVGIYTPEEVQDFDDKPMVNITPSETDTSKPTTQFKNAAGRNLFCKNVKESIANAKSQDELKTIHEMNDARFDEMDKSGAEADQLGLEDIRQAYRLKWNSFVVFDNDEPPAYLKDQMAEFTPEGFSAKDFK